METAVINADGPGSGIISILFLLHSLIKIFPGSEIVGVPASDIKDTIDPLFKIPIILLSILLSLNL